MKTQVKRIKIDPKDEKLTKLLHESAERNIALKSHVKKGFALKTFKVNK